MADIFEQEVDEELRKDRYNALLRRYGPWVLGIAIVIVVVVGGWQAWESWSKSQRDAASETYVSAARLVENERWDAAEAALEQIAESGPDGYATLALMQRGAVALEQGDNDAARRYFEQAAARSPEPIVRDLATLKAALAGFESYSTDDLANRLGRIASGDNAMRHLAIELIASKALSEGDYARARQEYDSIVFALDAPDGVRVRASAALALLNRLDPPAAADDADVEGEMTLGDENDFGAADDALEITLPEASLGNADDLTPGSDDDTAGSGEDEE
ncbi:MULTISPECIES: tetratricopeptide repeat protein [Hyphobacterium]|uniref:Ancillary SecYEG translocon subunit n=1 Tax=Hyphobacterium vulgare TaxID=1736751 RepID=A0ABV7A167_9PROT